MDEHEKMLAAVLSCIHGQPIQVLFTPNFPFRHLTGVGSIDWHVWHSLTTALTALEDTDELVGRTK